MKNFLVLLALLIGGTVSHSATIAPGISPVSSTLVSPVDPIQYFSTLSLKEIQQLAGRKLKLKEKISVKIFQWKLKHGLHSTRQSTTSGNGKTAMIFGIIAIPLLFVPVIGPFAALISAVLAIVMGYSARKADRNDAKARVGIVLGWISLALFAIAVGIAVAVLI